MVTMGARPRVRSMVIRPAAWRRSSASYLASRLLPARRARFRPVRDHEALAGCRPAGAACIAPSEAPRPMLPQTQSSAARPGAFATEYTRAARQRHGFGATRTYATHAVPAFHFRRLRSARSSSPYKLSRSGFDNLYRESTSSRPSATGDEDGGRSRSRGWATAAFASGWTPDRHLDGLDARRVPKTWRPAQRAGIALNPPAGRDAAPAFAYGPRFARLDCYARALLGARGFAPHHSAGRWADLSPLGRRASDGSPGTPSIGLGANAPAWTACGLALVPDRNAARLPYIYG
ncbi:hypothetical protein PMO31116_04208 [Pandoraea morbifera]|uniref:Uncharacterized protein n=1 Tax=Pandoraea morbifera TaxID=2508300 RepID=A0A5E4Y3I8_9BURK|nr:hypothetical protein PMO31116_04208 [Pandoraea morbifera]